MISWLNPGEWIDSAKREFVRWQFDRLRPTVYEGLVNILNAPAGAAKPLWSSVFKEWASRAHRRGNKSDARLYRSISERLLEGQPLSKALHPFVPIEDALIIETGERTGNFSQALEMLANSYETEQAIRSATAGAFKAPAASLLSFLGISVLMGLQFWPNMLDAVNAKYWDDWAMVMVNFQMWLASNIWAPIPFIAVYSLYYYSKSNWSGLGRSWAEQMPMSPYSIHRDQTAAKFLLVLSSLMGAKMLMSQALEVISRSSTPYLRSHIAAIRYRKEAYPSDLSRMINTGLFNDQLLDRIANASMGMQPDMALQHIGSTAMNSVTDIVRKRANLAGVTLNSAVGLLIVWYSASLVIGFQVANDRMLKSQKMSDAQSTLTNS